MNARLLEVSSEAERILRGIAGVIPANVDGRTAIREMRNEGSRNWRQMEWIGFWLEHFVQTQLADLLQVSTGPGYGNVVFDLRLNRVWDLKAHPHGAGESMPLNDQEAVRQCVRECDGLGFIVVQGEAEYDTAGTFKRWHDEFKGGTSDYERDRVKRNAPSRRRKVSFRPTSATAFWIDSEQALDEAVASGWLKDFQTGMRNSNGVPRRSKYMLTPRLVPSTAIVGHIALPVSS